MTAGKETDGRVINIVECQLIFITSVVSHGGVGGSNNSFEMKVRTNLYLAPKLHATGYLRVPTSSPM